MDNLDRKQPVTRSHARAMGYARYYTGQYCHRGHLEERLTSNGSCVTCHRDKVHLKARNKINPKNNKCSVCGKSYEECDAG